MTLKFDRSFYWYTVSIFLFIIGGLSTLGWYHWTHGTFDIERIGQFYESSYKLNELNQRKSLEKINFYVSSYNSNTFSRVVFFKTVYRAMGVMQTYFRSF